MKNHAGRTVVCPPSRRKGIPSRTGFDPEIAITISVTRIAGRVLAGDQTITDLNHDMWSTGIGHDPPDLDIAMTLSGGGLKVDLGKIAELSLHGVMNFLGNRARSRRGTTDLKPTLLVNLVVGNGDIDTRKDIIKFLQKR